HVKYGSRNGNPTLLHIYAAVPRSGLSLHSENVIAKLAAKISILLAVTVGLHVTRGATITFGGNIIQSTQDGTGPAVNNPSLNNIQDLMPYTVTLGFAGSITAPGTYDLTGLTFSVPAAPAMETSFGFISLTITTTAGFDDLSL